MLAMATAAGKSAIEMNGKMIEMGNLPARHVKKVLSPEAKLQSDEQTFNESDRFCAIIYTWFFAIETEL